jgi:glucose-6-phosphate 1-dehydrogenase
VGLQHWQVIVLRYLVLFGVMGDLASARKLNNLARLHFVEYAIFSIDHYLVKKAIMNIL